MPASAIIVKTAGNPPQRQGGRAAGNAAAAAEKGAGIDDPGSLPGLCGRKRRQRQPRCQGIRHGQTGAHRNKPDRQQHHPALGDGCADDGTGDRDQRHAARHRMAQPEACRHRGSRQGERKQRRAQRQQGGAGLQRREAQSFPALRIEVEVEQQAQDAEHRQRADGHAHDEAAPREEGQVDERRLGARLHDQQQEERRRRQYERADSGKRCRPRMRQCMQPKNQRHHQRGQQNKADPIRTAALGRVSTCRAQACGGETGHGRDHERGVEPEDHAPAREVSERAAEQRPDAEAKHQEAGPCADRCCPALRRRAGVERG